MSWASRRKFLYLSSITLFFTVIIGVPIAYKLLKVPLTCFDNIQNQGETDIDKGGPCVLLDERYVQLQSTLWARAFRVRDGSYNVVTYIRNPNELAGVEVARYMFKLYDSQNILVAERTGETLIMPGGITPVIESRINTGKRVVVRTYFEFTEPLVWKNMQNRSTVIAINNKEVTGVDLVPKVTATVHNTSVYQIENVSFVAVVFDRFGNAFQASATTIDSFPSDESKGIIFTWPDAFIPEIGHVEILPIVTPLVTTPFPIKN